MSVLVLNNKMPTMARPMGDGHGAHSSEDCEDHVCVGFRNIGQILCVIDSQAFHFVSGTNFFAEPLPIQSLTLQVPYVLHVDHGDGRESVPVQQTELVSSYLRVCKEDPSTIMVAAKTEDYQLLGEVLDQGLGELRYFTEYLTVEFRG